MFPLHYHSLQEIQQFYAIICVRNLLLLGIAWTLLVSYQRRSTPGEVPMSAPRQPVMELAQRRE
jgi:hypothetical protein